MDFWEIYERHYSRVHGYASSMLRDRAAADDVVQETFLRAQASLDVLRESEKLRAWLFRIAHNLCMDHLRSRRSSCVESDADPESAGREASRVEHDLERAEMSSCVRAKVDSLPATDRAVILLYDLKELSQQEIADVLGIEVGTVKVRLHRARKKLRAVLEKECSFSRDETNVLVCDPKPPGTR